MFQFNFFDRSFFRLNIFLFFCFCFLQGNLGYTVIEIRSNLMIPSYVCVPERAHTIETIKTNRQKENQEP